MLFYTPGLTLGSSTEKKLSSLRSLIFFQVQRKQVETHLQTAMTVHLDLACLRLKEAQDVTRQLMEKFSTLQSLFLEKVLKDENKIIERENGTFLRKIHEFNEVFKQSKAVNKETVESVIPHTATYGYNVKVRIFPNGHRSGKNTYLSVYIDVMKGEYDAALAWPFSKKVQLTLIDRQNGEDKPENFSRLINPELNPPECFCRPKTKENRECGFPRFISHEKLKSRKYIVDDTLLLQVEIQEKK